MARSADLDACGARLDPTPEPELPAELGARLAADGALLAAFEGLTPGRRRSHVLHIAGAKRSETRAARVKRCAEKIRAGKGFNER